MPAAPQLFGLAALFQHWRPEPVSTRHNPACPSCVIVTDTFEDGSTETRRELKRDTSPVPVCSACYAYPYAVPAPP